MVDVSIIGAGVAGLTMATEIHARGGKVELIDTHSTIGAQACSWWAGGMLAPYCERESAEEPVLRLGLEAADWWDKNTQCVTKTDLWCWHWGAIRAS